MLAFDKGKNDNDLWKRIMLGKENCKDMTITTPTHLTELANRMERYEEAMDIKKKYEDIIKANKNNIIFFAYQKVKFLENLREIENLNVLLNNLKQLKVESCSKQILSS